MSYTYYPGCSAKGTGRSYEESLRAVFGALGTGLDELEDWNCCGASGYPAVDAAKAVALSARNLALAEGARPGPEPGRRHCSVRRLLPRAAQDRARVRRRRGGGRSCRRARWTRPGCGMRAAPGSGTRWTCS